MSLPEGRLWVNPEGVTAVGNVYRQHEVLYTGHLQHLQMLRVHYADAWGNDDMGKEFSAKFLAGLDALEGLIAGVRGTLDYTATALRTAGVSYRDADDSAAELTHKLAAGLDDTPAPTTPGSSGTAGKKA